jgi:hypothetical protein
MSQKAEEMYDVPDGIIAFDLEYNIAQASECLNDVALKLEARFKAHADMPRMVTHIIEVRKLVGNLVTWTRLFVDLPLATPPDVYEVPTAPDNGVTIDFEMGPASE